MTLSAQELPQAPDGAALQDAVDLRALPFAQGGHLLVKHALRALRSGERLAVGGEDRELAIHVRAWCRSQGHQWQSLNGWSDDTPWQGVITVGDVSGARWRGATRAGEVTPSEAAVHDMPPGTWGLAARGAKVEAGVPDFQFGLSEKEVVWTDEAPRLYAQAAAAQWDPNTAIDWELPVSLPDEIEDAIVQIMTYLIENETVALMVPARFLAQLHPHFREVMQLLAIQAADEARHIEVFTRRARLKREQLGFSSVGGQMSLKTLMDEPDFALAFFLLSVLGEGTFLSLLWFIHENAPDPVTRKVAQLTAQDEARHVAFGMAHLSRHIQLDPGLHGRLAQSVHMRHAALQHTAGLNEEVFDALVLLAAGAWTHEAIAKGHAAVMALQGEMDQLRQRRLLKLGFSDTQAAELSALHTRNFM